MSDSDVLHDTDIEQEVGIEVEAAIEPPFRVFVHNDNVTNAIPYYPLFCCHFS